MALCPSETRLKSKYMNGKLGDVRYNFKNDKLRLILIPQLKGQNGPNSHLEEEVHARQVVRPLVRQHEHHARVLHLHHRLHVPPDELVLEDLR